MSLALDLYVQAFGSPRTERSWPYKNGAKAALQRIFEGEAQWCPMPQVPRSLMRMWLAAKKATALLLTICKPARLGSHRAS
jgi:hypothetical protein